MTRYREKLLRDLDILQNKRDGQQTPHPAALWATSGLMALTGQANGPPTLCPVPLARCADDTLDAFRWELGRDVLPGVSGHHLLTERAALAGLQRRGSQSTSGHCRLLTSTDGVVAVNLARDSDWELVPAWLQQAGPFQWSGIASAVSGMATQILVERARLLGLAVTNAAWIPSDACPWQSFAQLGQPVARNNTDSPVVVDLTALWAGPLCSHLWQQAGARVIKVESEQRPDGSRNGDPAFFQRLNAGKEEITLPLHRAAGHRALLELISEADILLESSRPRALRQMGIRAEELLQSQAGLTWVSITGYGREDPESNWVAFGDDAGAAAGLSAILHAVTGEWLICADAIADPLTGLHAALAGWHYWRAGGGGLVALSLERTVRHCIVATAPKDRDYPARQRRWQAYLQREKIPVGPAPTGAVAR
jgi:hypothetical protein